MPLAKNHRGQRHVAAPGCHVGHKVGVLRQHQITASQRAQHSIAGQRAVAQAFDRQACGVHHGRVLAGGAQPQAQAGAVQQPPHRRHQRQRGINQAVVAQQASAQHRADHRPALQRCGQAGEQWCQPHGIWQGRRLATLLEPGNAQHDGQAGGNHRHRHAQHHLVTGMADAGITMHHGQGHPHQQRGQQRQRQRAGEGPHRTGGKGGQQHLALQPQVNHAGTLTQHGGQRAQDQRGGHPQCGRQQAADQCLIHGWTPPRDQPQVQPQTPPPRRPPAWAPTSRTSAPKWVQPPAPSRPRTTRSGLAGW